MLCLGNSDLLGMLSSIFELCRVKHPTISKVDLRVTDLGMQLFVMPGSCLLDCWQILICISS